MANRRTYSVALPWGLFGANLEQHFAGSSEGFTADLNKCPASETVHEVCLLSLSTAEDLMRTYTDDLAPAPACSGQPDCGFREKVFGSEHGH
jgi:hypothetical protein